MGRIQTKSQKGKDPERKSFSKQEKFFCGRLRLFSNRIALKAMFSETLSSETERRENPWQILWLLRNLTENSLSPASFVHKSLETGTLRQSFFMPDSRANKNRLGQIIPVR